MSGYTFALVPCSATKNPGRLPAREKYDGALFKKARDYAEAVADRYAILSGKYGALDPEVEIDDYDVSVRDRDPDVWADDVVEVLSGANPHGWDRLVVLAGAAYREPLAEWFAELEDAGVEVEVPLEGLRIGEQMSELNDALEAIEDPRELVTDGGEVELPDEVNGWSLALEAGSSIRYEGELVTAEIFGHMSGWDLKYGSPHTFQSLTLEESIEDRESAIERLLELVEARTPEEAGEHIERLQSDDEADESGSEPDVDADVGGFTPASEIAADGGAVVGLEHVDAHVDELDVIRGQSEEIVERRRDFIREVLAYLAANGSGSRSEIMDDLLPDEETSEELTGYAPLSAWKHLVRPSLSALAEDLDELESPGERGQGGWRWIKPEPTIDDVVREQVEAIEAGDVIRIKGTVDGEEVETRELEIVEDSASGFKVQDGADRFGVELTENLGAVAWGTGYGGPILVDEIELVDPGSLRDDEEPAEEAESDVEPEEAPEDVEDEDVDETPEESDEEPIDEDQRARELVVEEIVELLESDLSAAQALDYYMTETYEGTYGGFSQSGWGEIRGTSHQAISDSVRKARKALGRD